MSDLKRRPADHRARPTRGNSCGLRSRHDRSPIGRDRVLAALALLASACVTTPRVEVKQARGGAQVWVDAFAPAGGDGTRERPLKAIPGALPDGVELHLASGLYEGPFVLPDGAVVEGRGEVVLHATGEVVVTARRAALSRVSIQGGATGLLASGVVTLEAVRVSGFRTVGVRAEGAQLSARGLVVEGTIEGATGLTAAGGLTSLVSARFSGGLVRAVSLAGGRAVLKNVASEGGKTLVRALGVELDAQQLSASAGTGAALIVSGGRALLREVTVTGHEYALLASNGARLELRGLVSRGALVAGVSLLASEATLEGLTIERPGSHGALELLDSKTTVTDARVREARALGLWVRKGTATLTRVTVEGVLAEGAGDAESQGDAFHFRDAEVDGDELTARDVGGSGVYATAVANVRLGAVRTERTGFGALVVERGAKVTVRSLVAAASRGAAVSVLDHGTLELGRLEVKGADVPVWAECAEGADVQLGALVSGLEQPRSPCVGPLTRP